MPKHVSSLELRPVSSKNTEIKKRLAYRVVQKVSRH